MNHPLSIGVSLGGAATTFWFPLTGQHAAIASEHTLFPVEGLENQNILVLSPELAWTFPAFPAGTIEWPEPVTGQTSPDLAASIGPLAETEIDRDAVLSRVSVSEGAGEFAARADLDELLVESVALAFRFLWVVGTPRVDHEVDPESGDPYLVVNFKVAGSVGEVVQALRQYAREWSRLADWPRVNMIRHVFDLDR